MDFNLINMLFLSFNFYFFPLGIINIDNIIYRLVYFLFFGFLFIISCFICNKARKNIISDFLNFSFNLVEIKESRRVFNLIDWNFKKNEFLMENKIKNKFLIFIFMILGGCFFIFSFLNYNMHVKLFYAFWAWFFSYLLSLFIIFNIYKLYLSNLIYKSFFK